MSSKKKGKVQDLAKAAQWVGGTALAVALEAPLLGSIGQRFLSEHHRLRDRAFFEGLRAGKTDFTEELLEDNDTAHAVISTMDAARRAESEDKAHRLGRLCAAYMQKQVQSLSELDEIKSIVQDLSEREWLVVLILYGHFDTEDRGGFRRLSGNWTPAQVEIIEKAGIPEAELPGFLKRLERTGIVRLLTANRKEHPPHACLPTARLRNILEYLGVAAEPPQTTLPEVLDEDQLAAEELGKPERLIARLQSRTNG